MFTRLRRKIKTSPSDRRRPHYRFSKTGCQMGDNVTRKIKFFFLRHGRKKTVLCNAFKTLALPVFCFILCHTCKTMFYAQTISWAWIFGRFLKLHQVWLKNATESRFFLAEYDRLLFFTIPMLFKIGFRRSNLTVERFFDFCPCIRTYAVIKNAQNRIKRFFSFCDNGVKSALRSFSKSTS